MADCFEKFISPEMRGKFSLYEKLLRDWNRRTGLVQQDTLVDFDGRHLLDSVQLIPTLEKLKCYPPFDSNNDSSTKGNLWISSEDLSTLIAKDDIFPLLPFFQSEGLLDNFSDFKNHISVLDVGTGAGFPGMVLAMCGFHQVTLCESNHKKCLFLEELARLTDTNVKIFHERVENIHEKYDLIVSRACADLSELCKIMNNVSRETSGIGIFHKGKTWKEEVSNALLNWRFDSLVINSVSSEGGVLVCLKNISKRIS